MQPRQILYLNHDYNADGLAQHKIARPSGPFRGPFSLQFVALYQHLEVGPGRPHRIIAIRLDKIKFHDPAHFAKGSLNIYLLTVYYFAWSMSDSSAKRPQNILSLEHCLSLVSK